MSSEWTMEEWNAFVADAQKPLDTGHILLIVYGWLGIITIPLSICVCVCLLAAVWYVVTRQCCGRKTTAIGEETVHKLPPPYAQSPRPAKGLGPQHGTKLIIIQHGGMSDLARTDSTPAEMEPLAGSYLLAVDIEGSGQTKDCTTIAIGAVLADQDGKEIDVFKTHGFVPGKTVFEKRCWDEFWSKFPARLKELEYDGEDTYEQRQAHMVRSFHAWRVKCEAVAAQHGCSVRILSDNGVYDLGGINDMMQRYMPDTLPMPYTATPPQQWGCYEHTGSLRRGVLVTMPAHVADAPGVHPQELLEMHYGLPKCAVEHDHDPCNDARNILHDYMTVMRVRRQCRQTDPTAL